MYLRLQRLGVLSLLVLACVAGALWVASFIRVTGQLHYTLGHLSLGNYVESWCLLIAHETRHWTTLAVSNGTLHFIYYSKDFSHSKTASFPWEWEFPQVLRCSRKVVDGVDPLETGFAGPPAPDPAPELSTHVQLRLWVAFVALAPYPVIVYCCGPARRWRRRRRGLCVKCGYNLRGLTEPRCPECFNEFDPSTLLLQKQPGLGDPPDVASTQSKLAQSESAR